MAERFRKAFFAYPGKPSDLSGTINTVVKIVQASPAKLDLHAWPQTDVFGANIPDEIRNEIADADVLICDITRANPNVYYEIGFAIGREKTIAPVVNASFSDAISDIRRDGLFDNIGYQAYENSEQLTKILLNLPTSNLIELYSKPLNYKQLLFVLDTFRKTDFRNAIVSAIKKSKIFYRSFDPVETPRFSCVAMIGEVTASAGVVVPILADHIDDASKHNLRGAFLAGLAHGLQRPTLLMQMERHNVNPADYRDLVTTIRNESDISKCVSDFSPQVLVASQSITSVTSTAKKSELQRLTLGASAAENEFRTLEEYFVETSEFLRTIRGEVRIIAGRKGSGKTAIFFRARDTFRQDRECFVTDLKPESHQLSLFREELLKIVDAGTFDHTLAAFWYFVIVSELLLTIKREADYQAKFDSRALATAREIDQLIDRFAIFDSGDFTSRINRLGSYVVQEINRLKSSGGTINAERLTNIIFRDGVAEIRTLIHKHTDTKSKQVFLFDNIDKGWPANGVHTFDIRLVRLLVEALDKVKRDFDAQHRDFMSVVFLRNDIYELLVDETPDRGKSAEQRIDWTDRSKLRQVIHRRLQASVGSRSESFEHIWSHFFSEKVDNIHAFDYFVDHCLMRPRFLINIIENAVAHAINRGHQKVEEEDCRDAVRQHSSYLVDDFGYEIRDVSGLSAEILYAFIGVTELLTRDEVSQCFRDFGLSNDVLDEAFKLMLWYGVLGVVSNGGKQQFIYDYEYRMKRLEAEIRVLGEDVLYVVNPAFHVALRQ